MLKRFFAEFLATAILVLIGCGTAMGFTFLGNFIAASAAEPSQIMMFEVAKVVGIAAAFGLSIIVLAYTVGPISGGHANPAVSFAKALNKEITWKEFAIYCGAQVLGAFFGSLLLAMVMWSWKSGVAGQNGMSAIMWTAGMNASGSTDPSSAGAIGMTVMLSTMAEMGLTFLFVLCVLGVTSKKEWSHIAGIVIGLALFGVHIVGIPLTGTSVNPARALSALVFSLFNPELGADEVKIALLTLIPVIVGPFMGSFAAASTWKAFNKKKAEEQPAA